MLPRASRPAIVRFLLVMTLGGPGLGACTAPPAPEMRAVSVPDRGGRPLYVARVEVTFADWWRCYEAGGCAYMPKAPGGTDLAAVPVVSVNWFDVTE